MTPAHSTWRIVPLADFPAAIPTLVDWFHAEWFAYDGRSRVKIAAQLQENLQRDRLPITFLTMREDEVLGTASLDVSDLPSHDHLTPWLASVYVTPSSRGLGIATALVTHVTAFAQAHGISQIHLWTPGSTALYEKLGWRPLERATSGGRPIQIMFTRTSADSPAST